MTEDKDFLFRKKEGFWVIEGSLKAALLKIRGKLRLYLLSEGVAVTLGLAATAGLAGAFCALLFRTLFFSILGFFKADADGLVALAHGLPWWARLLLPTVGGFLAGAILHFGSRFSGRHGSDTYMEALTIGDGRLNARRTLVRSLSSICSIDSGASIGREGPMTQLAALAGSLLGRLFGLSGDRLRLLVACGATAGLSAVYHAPIAALLFVAEIALGSLSREFLAPLIIASVTASTVADHFFGIEAVYKMPAFSVAFSGSGILLYAVLGLLCGLLAPGFRKVLDLSRQTFRRIRGGKMAAMTLGGLGVGLLSLWMPEVWGNGYSVVTALLRESWAPGFLLLLLVCKIAATGLSYGSGAVGGLFTPSLFVGAAFGSLYGTGLLFIGAAPEQAASYAIVGMGAFLAAVTYAPLMSILMLFEMTLSYEIVLPLMLACVLSHQIAQRFRPDSIYRKEPGAPSPVPNNVTNRNV